MPILLPGVTEYDPRWMDECHQDCHQLEHQNLGFTVQPGGGMTYNSTSAAVAPVTLDFFRKRS
jgi:hypothetical protein